MRIQAILLALLIGTTSSARAELEWIQADTPQMVFAGRPQEVNVTIHNNSTANEKVAIRTRIVQLSSASAMPAGDAQEWRTLRLFPDQTVLEVARLSFPAVKSATTFEIHWLNAKDKVLGRTSVQVHPDDLLKRLATLAGQKAIGVIDPDSQLKHVLKRLEVEFEDLEDGAALEKFEGKLMIVFTRSPKQTQTRHLSERVIARMKEGMAVVWVQWPGWRSDRQPLAYPLRAGAGTMVFAEASTVADLANSPRSQLNLIRFAEIAMNPGALQLPETP